MYLYTQNVILNLEQTVCISIEVTPENSADVTMLTLNIDDYKWVLFDGEISVKLRNAMVEKARDCILDYISMGYELINIERVRDACKKALDDYKEGE